VTLAAFQRALCDMIRSPDACLDLRAGTPGVLTRYDLSPRERDRLMDIVWQRGMSTNCTLYRSNRVTPIYTLLHYTCLVLGDRLKDTLDAYWAASALHDLEFKHEIHRFSRFVREQIEASTIVDPFVEEVLEFEIAINDLRFAPRRDVLRGLHVQRETAVRASAHFQVHPLIRVIPFRHEPGELLRSLANRRVPRELPEVESFLVLSRVEEELSTRTLEPALGRVLWRLQTDGAFAQSDEIDDLVDTGLVVRIG
jgi:hypothetical protein